MTEIANKVDAGVSRRPRLGAITAFMALISLGVVVTLYPLQAVGFLAAVAAFALLCFALRYVRRSGLDLWQILLLTALSGYIVLNYGFENLAFHVGGVPIIVSYMLAYAALGLAIFAIPNARMVALQEPALYFLLTILAMTLVHLLVNVPQYGIWAIRDASLAFDSMFIVMGFFWARRSDTLGVLMKWLMIIFLLNSFYSLSLPWQDQLQAHSPSSGVFLQISLLGYYRGNMLFCLLGCVFYLFFGRSVAKWPRWLLGFLMILQLFALAILQARAMYVGLIVVIVLLFLIGEVKRSGRLLLLLGAPVVAVLALTATGIEIPGRIGPVNADFFVQHFRSISGAEDTPGSTLEGRMTWYDEVFARIRKNPWLGEGFGQPLITFENDVTGGAVRQPHNSTVTILARLGIAGLLPWLALHVYVLSRFVYAYRQRRRLDKHLSDFVLWLFITYLVFMIGAAVEAAFEFPSIAIPFYFFLGLALGLIRWQVPLSQQVGVLAQAPVMLAPSLRHG
jgi:O-antigen ligase